MIYSLHNVVFDLHLLQGAGAITVLPKHNFNVRRKSLYVIINSAQTMPTH